LTIHFLYLHLGIIQFTIWQRTAFPRLLPEVVGAKKTIENKGSYIHIHTNKRTFRVNIYTNAM
jgi:hypothetical protein